MAREQVAIALGSNLGDRHAMLTLAREAIAALPQTTLLRASPIEETAPIGPVDQPAYLNQMVLAETGLEPRVLLDALLGIERAAGRVRAGRWGPRTLDCDIVLYGARTVRAPDLVIPHPELSHRDFWQRELQALDVQLPIA